MKSVKTASWILGGLLLVALVLDLSGILAPVTGGDSFFLGSLLTLAWCLGGASLVRFVVARKQLSRGFTWMAIILLYFGFFILRTAIAEGEEYRPSLLFLLSVVAAFRILRSEKMPVREPVASEVSDVTETRVSVSPLDEEFVDSTPAPSERTAVYPETENQSIAVEGPGLKSMSDRSFLNKWWPVFAFSFLFLLATASEALEVNTAIVVSNFGILIGGFLCGAALRFLILSCGRFEQSQYGPGIAALIYGVAGIGVVILLNQLSGTGLDVEEIVTIDKADATLGFVLSSFLGFGFAGSFFQKNLGRRPNRILAFVALFFLLVITVIPVIDLTEARASTKALEEKKRPDWRPVSIDGNDYVSAAQIKTFYQFEEMESLDGLRHFKHPSLTMLWSSGAPFISINSIKVDIDQPLRERGGDIWISTDDLTNLVDPIVRPSHSGDRNIYTTVIIDPMQDESAEVGKETLLFALELEKSLSSQGIKTVLTRRTNVDVTNDSRGALIDAEPQAVYIALGLTDSNGKEERGVSSVALVQPGDYEERAENITTRDPILDKLSASLAVALHSHAMSALRIDDLGVSRVEIDSFSSFAIPTALIELPRAAELANKPGDTVLETRRVGAAGIALGFLKFREATQKSPESLPDSSRD